MKRNVRTIVVIGIFLVALIVAGWLVLDFTAVPDGKVQSSVAAMAVLEENGDISKEQLLKKAERYCKAKAFCGSYDCLSVLADRFYGMDEAPVLYSSVEELKGGPEESLEILNDYEHLMDGKEKPEMPGYDKDDFFRLLDERIRAEQAVLEKLTAEPNPELYDICLELYRARKEHPVIY